MEEFVLMIVQKIKEFILADPANLPPLLPTLISVVAVIAVFTIIYIFFSIFKKKEYWGVVYDSVTKQPLDPAVVELRDNVGKRVGNAITDMDGRYSFPGQVSGMYTITAKKTNYAFPSQKLIGHTSDGMYSDLYFGEQLFISKDEGVIIKNIPLDPVGFDWNEHEKKGRHMLHSYSHNSHFISSLTHWPFIIFSLLTVIAGLVLPSPYWYWAYLPLVLLICFNIYQAYFTSSRSYGMVVEKESGASLPFALVNIFYDTPSAEPIKYATKKCNNEGKYYCLLPNGRYYVIIERWIPTKTHPDVYTPTQIYTSKPFEISNGVLDKTFEI